MSGSTAKEKVLPAIEKLPADATLEDAIERLILLAKIERGQQNWTPERALPTTRRSADSSGDPDHVGTSGDPRRRGDTGQTLPEHGVVQFPARGKQVLTGISVVAMRLT
jgi:hypothetical protein